jgi:peptidoglycan hydrolase-like protein with peptidoglycan-binding domain
MKKLIASAVLALLLAPLGFAEAAGCVSPGLSVGSKGDSVRTLQQFLVAQNYPGGGSWMVTGNYGQATAAAVRIFQGQHGLAQTGAVDAATASATGGSCGGSGAYYGPLSRDSGASVNGWNAYQNGSPSNSYYTYPSTSYTYPYSNNWYNSNSYQYPYNYGSIPTTPILTTIMATIGIITGALQSSHRCHKIPATLAKSSPCTAMASTSTTIPFLLAHKRSTISPREMAVRFVSRFQMEVTRIPILALK